MSTDKSKFLSKHMYRSYGNYFWRDIHAAWERRKMRKRKQCYIQVTSDTTDFYFTNFYGRTPRVGERIVLSEPEIKCFRVDEVDWWPHSYWGPEINLRCTEVESE